MIEISQSSDSILFLANELFSKKVKACKSFFSAPKVVKRRFPLKKVFLKFSKCTGKHLGPEAELRFATLLNKRF